MCLISGLRVREDLLMDKEEMQQCMDSKENDLSDMNSQESMEFLLNEWKGTRR